MKKIGIITFGMMLSFVFHSSVLAVAAVDGKGQCHEFKSVNDIPDKYWKTIVSCSLVKDRTFGQNMEDKMNKRHNAYFKKKQSLSKNKKKKQRRSSARRYTIGTGGMTKIKEFYKRDGVTERYRSTNKKRRSYTRRNYDRAAYNRYKKLNPQLGGLVHDGDTTSAERKKRRTGVHARLGSSTGMKRDGYLTTPVRYSDQRDSRYNRRKMGKERVWKGHRYMNKKKKKKKYEYKAPMLRRSWKGGRLEGSLDMNR